MAAQGDHPRDAGLVSMRELLEQIDTNKKHFLHCSKSNPELHTTIGSGSPLRTRSVLPTALPSVREVDNDPDTFMLMCLPLPVMTLQGIRRRLWTWMSNLLWSRQPLPCVTTTCGPIHHVRSCKFHPLSGALPYKMPMRRSISLPTVKVQRSASLPARLHSSSSLPAPSPSTSASTSASTSDSPPTSPSTCASSTTPPTASKVSPPTSS